MSSRDINGAAALFAVPFVIVGAIVAIVGSFITVSDEKRAAETRKKIQEKIALEEEAKLKIIKQEAVKEYCEKNGMDCHFDTDTPLAQTNNMIEEAIV